MTAYYNECEPFAAAWLRELMADGLIAPGVVDDRPIQEVQPRDVESFTQAHFFAGIGVWSLALRSAGWPDDRPVWTGSCPCQPFSGAGKRQGTADERHLWPEWFRLIRESRPDVLFGEQVSSPDGLVWVDAVSADLEPEAYAFGALDTCAAGVGAPHIRQRLYFVADANRSIWERSIGERPDAGTDRRNDAAWRCAASGLAAAADTRPTRSTVAGTTGREKGQGQGQGDQPSWRIKPERSGVVGPMDHADSERSQGGSDRAAGQGTGVAVPGGTRGFWSDAEWIACTDGKLRPTQPGIFPLAPRTPGRVGLLRGAGNALCRPQATAFIHSYLDVVAARSGCDCQQPYGEVRGISNDCPVHG